MVLILLDFGVRIANAGGTFNVQQVSFHVPWVWVRFDNVFPVVDYIRTVLLEESQKRGATRASIEPKYQWIRSRVAFRVDVYVMQSLSRLWDFEVTTVPGCAQIGYVWQRRDSVSCYLGMNHSY